MPRMRKSLIRNALGFISIGLLISACSSKEIEPVEIVEVRTIEISRPAPVVPEIDQLKLRPVQWIIITPENAEQKLNEIKNGEAVLFALTTDDYENISLNLSDVRAAMDQQKKIIAVYKSQFE
jgi:hypothetical protein